jgi:hypothetical protein
MTDVVAAVGAVTAAVVTGLFAVLTSVMRRENNEAHAENTVMLRSIDERTQRLDERTDAHGVWMARHADWHAHKGDAVQQISD